MGDSPGENYQEVELSSLQLPQLESIQKKLNSEIDFLSNSCQQLKFVQQKFVKAAESVAALSQQNEDKEVMIPLTEAMYVPGKLKDTKKVTIDIGTNYFVEMDVDKAKAYFDRKVKYVTKQLEGVQENAQQRINTRNGKVEILELSIEKQLVIVKSEMSSEELLAILQKTGKECSHVSSEPVP